MPRHSIRRRIRCLPLVVFVLAPPALALGRTAIPAAVAQAMAQASQKAIAEYGRKLAEYQEARAGFDAEAGAYWDAISQKRRGRNAKRRDHQPITLDDYVLTQ